MPSRAFTDRAPLSVTTVLRQDAPAGLIHLPDQQRVVALSEPVVQGLHYSIINQLGDIAQDALYRSGYEWALQEMLQVVRQARLDSGAGGFNFWSQDAAEVLPRWWSGQMALGWGEVSFDFRAAARGLTFVNLRQSIVADVFAGADQPVCHLYAGLFAGAVSFFERTERHGVEVQCAAMGHPACHFIVGPGAEIDAAEAWRQQGVAAPEILRRLG
jgi:predicted hydrocarbon binding protein